MTINPTLLVLLGTFIQTTIIVSMRKFGIGFWTLLPVTVLMQYCFMTAYLKAENFTVIWFVATGMTGLAAVLAGYFVFGEKLGVQEIAGILLIVSGIVALRA
jgi:multidrug transporter EmrE-like cation transporter